MQHQPHHVTNDTTSQEVRRARLVDLEEYRLFPAKVGHSSRPKHKVKIRLRRAVVVEDLSNARKVAEVASSPKRRGAGRTVSAR